MAGGPQILARKLALALVFPALGYALYATGQQAVESRRMAQQVAELQRTVDGLAVENIRLQNELMYRRSDEYVERVAREELGLVMPGDTAVDVVGENLPKRDATAMAKPADPAPRPPVEQQAPLEAWLSLFSGGS
jgi:cell division protein DivIC